ncbi:hypothetical protein ACUJ63_004291 [Salmonella enterica subsp. enterica]
MHGGGYWWKGTSLANVSLTNQKVEFQGISTSSGQGLYRLRGTLVLPAGEQDYYRATGISGPWEKAVLSHGILPDKVEGCVWGYVVWAKPTITAVEGGGAVSVEITNTKPLPVPVTYPGLIAAGIHSNVDVDLYPGLYMVGTSAATPIAADIDLRVIVKVVAPVKPGTYPVLVSIPISADSAWFAPGTNYWWETNPSHTPEYNTVFNFTTTIRINQQGYPDDPNVSCSLTTPYSTIAHGQLRADVANGNEKSGAIVIQCNGSSSADIVLTGGGAHGNGIAVKMGNGVSSILSVSKDRSNWKAFLTGTPLKSGYNTIYLRSVLDVENDKKTGSYTGSAVAVVRIN